MQIGNTQIGLDHPPYIIAEIGVNHDGDVERALSLTDAAAEAGADAVKLQFFETDRLMSKAAKLAAYQKNAGETDPIEMLRRLELSIDEMARVVERAHERGIHAIVTVFSTELVEAAETLAWDAYKTASPDIVNRPLLEALAATGKPMIVSTGASEADEVRRARLWLDDQKEQLGFLQCVSNYPTADEDANCGVCSHLRAIVKPCVYGYSDHTVALATGQAARGYGATIFEKHFTDDTMRHGPDHLASLTVDQFAKYVMMTKAERDDFEPGSVLMPLMGTDGKKRVLDCERDVREVSRQSVVSTRAIALGEKITRDMLTIKRPGTGILAYRLDEVVGSVAKRAIEADVPIAEEDLA